LSWRAYGKHGMTAVTREAEAILQALIMMSNSITGWCKFTRLRLRDRVFE
jgi:hypothetical protein